MADVGDIVGACTASLPKEAVCLSMWLCLCRGGGRCWLAGLRTQMAALRLEVITATPDPRARVRGGTRCRSSQSMADGGDVVSVCVTCCVVMVSSNVRGRWMQA